MIGFTIDGAVPLNVGLLTWVYYWVHLDFPIGFIFDFLTDLNNVRFWICHSSLGLLTDSIVGVFLTNKTFTSEMWEMRLHNGLANSIGSVQRLGNYSACLQIKK